MFHSSKIKTQSFTKGSILQRAGDLNTRTYFVKKGLIRSYTIDEKGKEHIYMFAPEGWIVSDIAAQTSGQAAKLFIDCLEDCEIEHIDFEESERILNQDNNFDKNAQIRGLLKRVAVLQKRVLLLMSSDAKERYLDFLDTYPNISQRVPQKMIASYLGITPEALSKIKHEILHG